jgi:hypothetical protein
LSERHEPVRQKTPHRLFLLADEFLQLFFVQQRNTQCLRLVQSGARCLDHQFLGMGRPTQEGEVADAVQFGGEGSIVCLL